MSHKRPDSGERVTDDGNPCPRCMDVNEHETKHLLNLLFAARLGLANESVGVFATHFKQCEPTTSIGLKDADRAVIEMVN